MTRVEIVAFRADLLEDAARLRSEIRGASPTLNLAYLEWKYRHNPYLREPVMQFALAESRVVGLRASVGTCWEIPGTQRRHLIPHGADAVIDPAYRGRGVFRALIARAREAHSERGFGQTISLSANAVSEAVLDGEGWRVVGTFETLEHRPARSRGSRSGVARLAARAFPLAAHHPPVPEFDDVDADGVTVAASPRPEAMVELWRRSPAMGRLRHVRYEAYVGWRYGNPLSDYRFLFLGGETLDAYAVAQWGRAGRIVSLVDWAISTVEALLRLLDTLDMGGFDCIRTWSSTVADEEAACLAPEGYLPASRDLRGVSFLICPRTGTGPGAWLIDGIPVKNARQLERSDGRLRHVLKRWKERAARPMGLARTGEVHRLRRMWAEYGLRWPRGRA